MDWTDPSTWFDSKPKDPNAAPDPGFLTKAFSSPWVSLPYAVGSGLLAASAPNYGSARLASGINGGLQFGMGAEKSAYDRDRQQRLSDSYKSLMQPQPSTVYAPNTPSGNPPMTEERMSQIQKGITPTPPLTGKLGDYANALNASGHPDEAMKYVGGILAKDDNVQIVTLADGSKAYFDKGTRQMVKIPDSGTIPGWRATAEAGIKAKTNLDRAMQGLPEIDENLPLAQFYREAGIVTPQAAPTVATPSAPTQSFPTNVDVRPGPAAGQDRKTVYLGGSTEPSNVPAGTTTAQLKIINDAMKTGASTPQTETPAPAQPAPAAAPPATPTLKRFDAKGRPVFDTPGTPTGANSKIFADFEREKKAAGWTPEQIRNGWTAYQGELAKAKAKEGAMGGIEAKNTPAARAGAANVAGGRVEGAATPEIDKKTRELDLEKMQGLTLDAKTGEVVSITKGDYARSPKSYIPLTSAQETIKGATDTAKNHIVVTSKFIGELPSTGLRVTNALGQKISELQNNPGAVALFQQLGAMTSVAAGGMLAAGGGGRAGVRMAEFMKPAGVNEGDTLAVGVKKMQTWMDINSSKASDAGLPTLPYEKAKREMNLNVIRALVKDANGNVNEAKKNAKALGLTLD